MNFRAHVINCDCNTDIIDFLGVSVQIYIVSSMNENVGSFLITQLDFFFCGKGLSWGPWGPWGPTPYSAYIPGAPGPRQIFFFPVNLNLGPWGPTPCRDSIKKKVE